MAVMSRVIATYAKQKKRTKIIYGSTPSVPTMPSRITAAFMHLDRQSTAIAKIGAVVRLM
jgi:hypothetical protein